jgi:hypothetical protein
VLSVMNPCAGYNSGSVASLLAASRQICYRGDGQILQVPWRLKLSGTFLVVDLFDGLSVLFIALLALGVSFIGATADTSNEADYLSKKNFPDATRLGNVSDVHGHMFKQVLAKKKLAAILVCGGSPCQGNSILGNRRGLKDARTLLYTHILRLADELEALPERGNTSVLRLLENVYDMPAEVHEKFSADFNGKPLYTDAGMCGYVKRRRAWWGGSKWSPLSKLEDPNLPEGLVLEKHADSRVVCWVGSKPIPSKIHILDGFQMPTAPEKILADGGRGAISTFVREWNHPRDRTNGISAKV